MRFLKFQRWMVLLALAGATTGVWQAEADEASAVELTPIAESRAAYQRALEDLADACIEAGEPRAAEMVRALVSSPVRGKQRIYLPPVLSQSVDALAQIKKQELRRQLQVARRKFADQLWLHVDANRELPNVTETYQLAHEAAFVDPTQPEAKRVVAAGYSSRREGVARPARSRHKEYGWLAGSYWRVKTDHFLIVTNHSARAATDAAQVLEETYSVWRQLFASLWLSPETLRRVIDGAQLPTNRRHHKVVLFADRAEYLRRLKQAEPNVALSTGMYRDVASTSYFYMDTPLRTDTWRHELTHQLFQEILKADPGVGEASGFWAVEAVALYMESTRPGAGYYELGGVESRRLQYARYRALNEQYYIPIAKLSEMTKSQLQNHPEIRKLYSQAAGLAHFLMDDHKPLRAAHDADLPTTGSAVYRSAFIEYLGDLYRTPRRAHSLAERSGTPPARLDFGYHEYLKVDDRDLASLRKSSSATSRVRALCLGHTNITDRGLRRLVGLDDLEWLDLTACRITDDGVKSLPAAPKLKRLSLERTRITDLSCDKLSTFVGLEELDLSHTEVTDVGIASLATLQNLRSLWLTGAKVGDEAVPTIVKLKQLEHLNLNETSVSQEAWQELKAALPRLGAPGALGDPVRH
jgi:hypothetical protein